MRAILAAIFFMGTLFSVPAYALTITGDFGGLTSEYEARYERLRASGESVVIDGPCESNCTLVVNYIPRSKICVTERASLAFHALYSRYTGKLATPERLAAYLAAYPADIRNWIKARGGLTRNILRMQGRDLTSRFRTC